ncbi:unnamed protein product [Rhizoctonia solani]|uniref:Uncharacterized protein n=1 Tax=Rhizoctonia solani TaxID=456999 RepID=A0A8H3B4R2_9AGAM|nr:unnamed protein product [Rhizoctonia solani]
MNDMVIDQQSIERDLIGLFDWIKQLDPKTMPPYKLYCDKETRTPANANRIRAAMKTHRQLPTFIYLAGHTEVVTSATQPSNFQLTYAPADHLHASPPAQPQVIPYEMMRQWLLDDRHLESLLFITEVCYCKNFLCLPYELEYDGSEARWKKTDYHGTFKGSSSDIVHFAATSPGERAMCFSDTGAIFTKAFCNISPSEPLALKGIAEKLQKNVDTIVSSNPQQNSQHPKIYSSRIIDDPHFFATLGFCSSNSPVATDSDSSG